MEKNSIINENAELAVIIKPQLSDDYNMTIGDVVEEIASDFNDLIEYGEYTFSSKFEGQDLKQIIQSKLTHEFCQKYVNYITDLYIKSGYFTSDDYVENYTDTMIEYNWKCLLTLNILTKDELDEAMDINESIQNFKITKKKY